MYILLDQQMLKHIDIAMTIGINISTNCDNLYFCLSQFQYVKNYVSITDKLNPLQIP